MTQVVVFGAGKIAHVVHALVADDPQFVVAGFTCDRDFMGGHEFCGRPLVAFEEVETFFPASAFAMLVAIGYQDNNRVRAHRCEQARAKGYQLVSWVSPRAHVPTGCRIGTNCVIMDGASIQPHARLGDDVVLWSGAAVGHHAVIGDHCWLASNCTISSMTTIEPRCFIGVGAAVGHGITIGADSIVGAGAMITHNTEPAGVYIVRDTPRFRLDSRHFMKIGRILETQPGKFTKDEREEPPSHA